MQPTGPEWKWSKQDYQPNGEFLIAVEIHRHAPLRSIISERNKAPNAKECGQRTTVVN
jgi:hypothetical protein